MITDVNMPGMDGFMLAERLRSMPSLSETAIIMLTSGGRPGDIQRCEELKVSAHLMKPIKHSELLKAIRLAVGHRSAVERFRADAVPEIDPLSLPPRKILLAEDGKANQMMAVGLLTKWGHQVTIAEDGEAAIERWRDGTFDLILMDVQMPVLDGLEATQRIRELEQNTDQHIPIVAMTARAMTGDRERCLKAGMDDYVSKPVRKAGTICALSGLRPPSAEQPAVDVDATVPVVDWEVSLEMLGGDRDLLRNVVDTMLVEMPALQRQLEDAIKEQDVAMTQRVAHTIKGEASAIAAHRTQRAAAVIEEFAANNDLESATRQMPCLGEAINKLMHRCGDLASDHSKPPGD